MNRTSTTFLLAAALSLAASAVAGPSPVYSPPSAKSRAPAKSTPAVSAKPAVVASTPEPKIFLVWRGAPKSSSAGPIYVDAAGRELAKSSTLAFEKASANAFAASEHAAKKAGSLSQ